MSINTNFYQKRTKVEWEGQEVCEVRGLTTNDLAQAMAENAADMEMLVRAFEGDQAVMSLDPSKPDEMAAAVAASTEKVFTTILASVPNLVGKLIAMACDSPEHWRVVMTWTVPLQFKVLQEIAVLTFVDQEGFRTFLGNVMALAGNVRGGQRHPVQNKAEQPTLSAG